MRLASRILGISAAFSLCAAIGAVACDDENVDVRPRLDGGENDGAATGEGGTLGCGVVVPASYVAPAFVTNAAAELTLTTNLAALDSAMTNTEGAATNTVTTQQLADLYNTGAPSLRAVSTSFAQTTVDSYLGAFGAAQGKTWDPANAEADGGAATGGKFKALFYESPIGVDLRRAVTKTILGGSLYQQALSIIAQGVSDAAVDRLLALFGASTSLANSTDGGPADDKLVAELASKRDDKSQPAGIYRQMRTALLTMKAAASNPSCKSELDNATAAYLRGWEQATYASAIFYLNAAATSAVNPDSAPLTLHSYGDALGLIQSFKGLPTDKRKIQDSQIEIVLDQMGATTPYKLLTDPGTRIAGLTSAINNVAAFEGFDATAVESFKKSF